MKYLKLLIGGVLLFSSASGCFGQSLYHEYSIPKHILCDSLEWFELGISSDVRDCRRHSSRAHIMAFIASPGPTMETFGHVFGMEDSLYIKQLVIHGSGPMSMAVNVSRLSFVSGSLLYIYTTNGDVEYGPIHPEDSEWNNSSEILIGSFAGNDLVFEFHYRNPTLESQLILEVSIIGFDLLHQQIPIW